jgi:hypothetical protein
MTKHQSPVEMALEMIKELQGTNGTVASRRSRRPCVRNLSNAQAIPASTSLC